MTDVVDELLARSHRLGADKRTTNYAGGNTSAKGIARDPVTGDDVELLPESFPDLHGADRAGVPLRGRAAEAPRPVEFR